MATIARGSLITLPDSPKRSIMFITGEKIEVNELPSHLLLVLPRAGIEEVRHAQIRLNEWMIRGGCLAISSSGDRPISVALAPDVTDHIVVESK